MALRLKPILEVLKDTRPLTPEYKKRADILAKRLDEVNQELRSTAKKSRKLPNSRPGFDDDATIQDAVTESGETTFMEKRQKKMDTTFAQRRLTTIAGIQDLERWSALKGDAVNESGKRIKNDLMRLALEFNKTAPQDHPARQLYNKLRGLDSQAVFVLARSGFYDRLKEVLGDSERGKLDTKNLFAAFDSGMFDSDAWDDLVEELRRAKQYNRRNLTI